MIVFFWSRDGVNVYITRNHRYFSRNTVNLATACCSCLVNVRLIHRGFREDGIKVIMLGADVMRFRPICSAPFHRRPGYSASQTCTVCVGTRVLIGLGLRLVLGLGLAL